LQYSNFASLEAEAQDVAIEAFYDLFAGRLDTYAIRMEFDGTAAYIPSTYNEKEYVRERVQKVVRQIGTPEFGPEAIRAHLEGKQLLGVYPIQPDSKVRWFALDFDGKTGDPWNEAVTQATIMAEAGLTVYIERSQSGNGYHIWGFLDAPVDAARVRHALSPLIEKVETYDRMFPNQNGVSETRPLGNLIALPLHGERMTKGNSSFVRRGPKGLPEVIPDQFAFIATITTNASTLIDELFEAAGELVAEREHTKYVGEAEGLRDSYKVTHPIFGCEFVRWCWDNAESLPEPLWYALACNLSQLEDGRELFHEWSAQDSLRYNARQTDKKYDQALRANAPHSCEVIRGLGGNCTCDQRFPGKAYHPFDLVKIPFKTLVESIGIDGELTNHIIEAGDGFDAAIARLRQIEEDPEKGQGRKYGIPSIDKATRMRDGELIIVAARPGMGKSAFSSMVADNLAMEGVPSYYFSAEMSSMQFFTRQVAIRTEVSLTRMSTGQLTRSDWDKIREAQQHVRDRQQYPVFVDDMSRSTERIYEIAARLTHLHGKGVIWIDYLQLLQRLPRESMFDAVTRIVHELQMLSKALDCPVVALAQLNRTADDATADSQTYDSWLRGSGDIEQAASVIMFILGAKGPGIVEREIALHKERHRESGFRFLLQFKQAIMRFAESGTWKTERPEPEIRTREVPRVTEAPNEAFDRDVIDASLKNMREVMGEHNAAKDAEERKQILDAL
jgi:hypothetical protein